MHLLIKEEKEVEEGVGSQFDLSSLGKNFLIKHFCDQQKKQLKNGLISLLTKL